MLLYETCIVPSRKCLWDVNNDFWHQWRSLVITTLSARAIYRQIPVSYLQTRPTPQLRYNSGTTPVQLRHNSGIASVQLRHNSGTIPVQLRYNSGIAPAQFRYSSGTTPVQLRYNSGTTYRDFHFSFITVNWNIFVPTGDIILLMSRFDNICGKFHWYYDTFVENFICRTILLLKKNKRQRVDIMTSDESLNGDSRKWNSRGKFAIYQRKTRIHSAPPSPRLSMTSISALIQAALPEVPYFHPQNGYLPFVLLNSAVDDRNWFQIDFLKLSSSFRNLYHKIYRSWYLSSVHDSQV